MKIKTYLSFAAVALLWAWGGSPAQARDFKIGVVDLSRVFKEYYKTGQANSRLENLQKELRRQRDAQEDDFKRLGDDARKLQEESQNSALATELREQKTKLFEEKLKDLNTMKARYDDFRRKSESMLAEQQATEWEKIMKGMLEEIQQIAKDDNYDFIFDRSGQKLASVPSVLFSKEEFDITDQLVKRLNAKAPVLLPVEPKAEEKKPEKPVEPKAEAPPAPAAK